VIGGGTGDGSGFGTGSGFAIGGGVGIGGGDGIGGGVGSGLEVGGAVGLGVGVGTLGTVATISMPTTWFCDGPKTLDPTVFASKTSSTNPEGQSRSSTCAVASCTSK
jgi:hypothetical protein